MVVANYRAAAACKMYKASIWLHWLKGPLSQFRARLAVTVAGHFAGKDDVVPLPRLDPAAYVLVCAPLLVLRWRDWIPAMLVNCQYLEGREAPVLAAAIQCCVAVC